MVQVDAKRDNKEKAPMHLLPWDAIEALAHHYRRGALKYDSRNWEKGLKWDEGCASSLARHLSKWSQGEDYELETLPDGTEVLNHHDEAMAWNALTLVAFRLRGVGLDDRPHKGRSPQPPLPVQGRSGVIRVETLPPG
jgi:hypothetical protein